MVFLIQFDCGIYMIYVSVVSHGHYDIITFLNSLKDLTRNSNVKVLLKDNVKDERLKIYCSENKITYLVSSKIMGFGENNNYIYNFIKKEITDLDFFVVLNPDVYVSVENLMLAVDRTRYRKSKISTVNLYRNNVYDQFDFSIRHYPRLIDFFTSYIFKKNRTIIDKSLINDDTYVDWAAGSFLIIQADLYRKLGGFDIRYFMYCEDIDICWRSEHQFGYKVLYLPDIKAIHYAQFNNRRMFSKHFYWHLKSIIRFLLVKNNVII